MGRLVFERMLAHVTFYERFAIYYRDFFKNLLHCRVSPGDRALTCKARLVMGSIPWPGLILRARFLERWLSLNQD